MNTVRFLSEDYSIEDFETALLEAIALPRGGKPEHRKRQVPTPAETLSELGAYYGRLKKDYLLHRSPLHEKFLHCSTFLLACFIVFYGR